MHLINKPDDEQVKLAQPFFVAVALWFDVNDKLVLNEPIALATCVQCLTDLGVLSLPVRRIWRLLRLTNLPPSLPLDELPRTILTILTVCQPSHAWGDGVAKWKKQNHERLTRKGLSGA